MSLLKGSLVVALGFISGAIAHGHCPQLFAHGQEYPGYNPYPYAQATDPTCGWRNHEIVNTAFINPDKYADEDIICHVGATHASEYVDITAGEVLTIQWTPWPESHHGPVITYMAPCSNGDCLTVNKADLKFHKIDAVGQIVTGKTDSDAGEWGADALRKNGNKYAFKVPDCIKPGPYVIRHEIIALMGANHPNGAQHYPNCINIMVKGSGTDGLEGGTKGTELYKAGEPGVSLMIYGPLNYIMPGPAVHTCGAGGEQTPTSTLSPTSTASGKYSYTTPSGSVLPTGYGRPSGYGSPSGTISSHPAYATGSSTPLYINKPTPSPISYNSNTYDKPQGGSPHNDKPHGGNPHNYYSKPDADKKPHPYYTKPQNNKTPNPHSHYTNTNTNKETYTTPKSNIADKPSADNFDIPADASIEQLMAWLKKILALLKAKLGMKFRRHARDVVA